ncbi:MBL fold metallo-hydrolase [Roseisolibacter sp. H3M3-2]|uniref:MBL fold metallo-hydrolase n=1 Tax=Roseisolibacter sp. H3M3-2 TaxID=3031323 RepID=UPI0023DA510D|nr:MBL fold metallo-hydrolase [Roseisolibacter sp. H3M3-2]MDF1503870.1 MBL fold metallo-hydrolase [Roseisolibacter sp. H3M3-2]
MRRGAAAAALALACAGCAHGVRDGVRTLVTPTTAVATTNGANASLILAARTDAGVVVVDLGWRGAERALDGALASLGATRRDVVAVLLTHAHRDHVGAWRAVAHAPFHVGAGEAARLAGRTPHRGWIPRLADRLRRPDLPDARVRVREVAGDTALVFGRDTVRAFALPGHTAGSVAWLVGGVLLVGDGASHGPLDGRHRPARRGFSDDAGAARRSLARLRAAVAPHVVRAVCTAHARCAPADPATWRRLGG